MSKAVLVLFFLVFFTVPLISSRAGEQQSKINPDEFAEVTIQELVSNPNTYTGQRVTLDGFVDKVEYKKSSKGEPFTLFRMNDGSDNEVRVYYEDQHLSLSKGDKVKIQGRYNKQKKYLLYNIKNVIKARTVEKL
jgi:uncharacterized membrane protein YcgQ (UPF0703/DUF1980 family)